MLCPQSYINYKLIKHILTYICECFLEPDQFLLRVFQLHQWYLFWHKLKCNLSIWPKNSTAVFSSHNFLKENRFSCCLLLNSSTILSLFIFLFNKSVFRAIFSRSALRIALRINNQAKSWTRSLTSVCPLALIRSSFYSTRLLVV